VLSNNRHQIDTKARPSLIKGLSLACPFTVDLRTNVRTSENWEQGRAKPNAQAALLINLVKRYPDTVERLATI